MFLAGKLLFVGSDTFVVGCIVLVTMRTGKNELKNANVSFLRYRKLRVHMLYSALLTVENLRRSISRTLLVTLEWVEFGCVRSLKANRFNRIALLF